MSGADLQLSEAGYVYVRVPSRFRRDSGRIAGRRMLGHISELLRERTYRGALVRRWWRGYLKRINSGQIAA
jgi:hypothetical protein